MSLLPTLSDARNILGDPALNFRWIVLLPIDIASNMTTNYPSVNSYSSSGGLLQNPSVPYGRVDNVTIPGVTIDVDARFGAAGKIHYPRFLDFEQCSLSLYEDMNYQSLYYMKSWQNLVVDQNRNYYTPSNYKRTVFFFAFDPVNSSSPTLTVEMNGCWPPAAGNSMQYEYTSSGLVTVPVTLQVDEVFFHFTNGNKQGTQDSTNYSSSTAGTLASAIA